MGLIQNRIVIKVGTSTLTNDLGKSDLRAFDRLACVLSDIQNMGYEVILVSSGAIAVGMNKLNTAFMLWPEGRAPGEERAVCVQNCKPHLLPQRRE